MTVEPSTRRSLTEGGRSVGWADTGPPPGDRRRWVTVGVLVLLVALLLVTRVRGVQLSLWWDEAFTAHRYIRGGPTTWLDPELYVANNHLLFTAVTWLTTRLTGTGEAALRLLAVVPATTALAGIAWWSWRRWGAGAGVLVLGVGAASSLLLSMSIQARGYGLVLAATTVLLLVTTSAEVAPRWWHDLLAAAAGVVAMTTFPPAVAAYLAHTGTWLLRRRDHRLRLVLLTAGAGLVTWLVYRPLVPLLLERSDRVGSRFADPITWWSPVVAPLQLVGGSAFDLGRGGITQGSVPALLAVVVGGVGLAVAWRRDRALGWQLVAGLGGSIVLLAPFGFHLADRYLSFLLPHAVLAVALGLLALVGGARRADGGARPASALAPAVLALLLAVAAAPGLWWTATTPIQAFAEASAEIRDRADAMVVVDRFHVGYRWYLEDVEVTTVRSQEQLDDLLCGADRPVVFARDPDRPELAVPGCLGAETERRFTHQRDPGYLSIWVVEPATEPAT